MVWTPRLVVRAAVLRLVLRRVVSRGRGSSTNGNIDHLCPPGDETHSQESRKRSGPPGGPLSQPHLTSQPHQLREVTGYVGRLGERVGEAQVEQVGGRDPHPLGALLARPAQRGGGPLGA